MYVCSSPQRTRCGLSSERCRWTSPDFRLTLLSGTQSNDQYDDASKPNKDSIYLMFTDFASSSFSSSITRESFHVKHGVSAYCWVIWAETSWKGFISKLLMWAELEQLTFAEMCRKNLNRAEKIMRMSLNRQIERTKKLNRKKAQKATFIYF